MTYMTFFSSICILGDDYEQQIVKNFMKILAMFHAGSRHLQSYFIDEDQDLWAFRIQIGFFM